MNGISSRGGGSCIRSSIGGDIGGGRSGSRGSGCDGNGTSTSNGESSGSDW